MDNENGHRYISCLIQCPECGELHDDPDAKEGDEDLCCRCETKRIKNA